MSLLGSKYTVSLVVLAVPSVTTIFRYVKKWNKKYHIILKQLKMLSLNLRMTYRCSVRLGEEGLLRREGGGGSIDAELDEIPPLAPAPSAP